MESLRGKLLAASPYLTDPNFARTVILVLDHGPQGAFGVVLNRPIGQTVRDLWSNVTKDSDAASQLGPIDRYVNFGGPVSGPLLAIHDIESLGELEVPPGIYVAADRQHLDRLIHQKEHPFRLFIGHAGWRKGQLEGEMRQGAWLTTPASAADVFEPDDDLWTHVVRKIGQSVIFSAIPEKVRSKVIPDNPSWN